MADNYLEEEFVEINQEQYFETNKIFKNHGNRVFISDFVKEFSKKFDIKPRIVKKDQMVPRKFYYSTVGRVVYGKIPTIKKELSISDFLNQ